MTHNLVAFGQALYHFNKKATRLTNHHVFLYRPVAINHKHRMLSVLAEYRRSRNHQHVIATQVDRVKLESAEHHNGGGENDTEHGQQGA